MNGEQFALGSRAAKGDENANGAVAEPVVQQEFRRGRDFVFTFGPWGFLYGGTAPALKEDPVVDALPLEEEEERPILVASVRKPPPAWKRPTLP